MTQKERLTNYKYALKRKESVDYFQWEQAQRIENSKLCDYVLSNSIKEFEVKIDKKEYINKKIGSGNVWTHMISLVVVLFTILPSVAMNMIQNVVAVISPMREELENVEEKLEFVQSINDLICSSYEGISNLLLAIYIFFIAIVIISRIYPIWSGNREAWEMIYNRDMLRLLLEEDNRRKRQTDSGKSE